MPERRGSLLLDDGGSRPLNRAYQSEGAARTYDHVADEYDDLYESSACLSENRVVKALIQEIMALGHECIADIGCGTGLLLDLISIMPREPKGYFGIDPCQKMLDRLLRKHPHATVSQARYEDIVPVRPDWVKTMLFGVPNYIDPDVLDVPNLSNYFMMFYRGAYRPSYYGPPKNEPYLGWDSGDYDFGDSYVTAFSNYYIVTDLL